MSRSRREFQEGKSRLVWKKESNTMAVTQLVQGSVTLLGNTVFCVGHHGSLALLDLRKWRWQFLGNDCLLGIGGWHIADLVNDKIYYFGGDGTEALVEYDTVLERARKVETLNEGPSRTTFMTSVFATWRNEIITFGGYSPRLESRTNDTHAYNVVSKSWRKLEMKGRLPKARNGHSSILHGTKMYIYGGYDVHAALLGDLWIAELSNFHAPSWSQPQTTGHSPSRRCLAVWHNLNGLLLVFGGFGRVGSAKNLELYFPEEKAWLSTANSQDLVQGTPPYQNHCQAGLTTSTGILYFTNDKVYSLSEE